MKKRERGFAVLIAMLVVALAATVAAYMVQRQDVALRSVEAARDHEQARWLLRGAAHWARAILAEDARANRIDHPGELWASGLPPTEVERGTLSGEIRDAQGLFNLANLARDGKPSEPDVAALRRLMQLLGLRPELADAVARAQPMGDLGELYGVRGIDPQAAAKLTPFVTLLPQRTSVNINTAPPEVLAALVDGLTLAEALVLAQERKGAPLRDTAELRSRLPRRELAPNADALAVQSAYFVVQGSAKIGHAQARVEALVQREGTGLPRILWQRIL